MLTRDTLKVTQVMRIHLESGPHYMKYICIQGRFVCAA